MDSSQQALQTDGKFFSNFEIIFELTRIFQNNSDVGHWVLMHAWRGGNCTDKHAFKLTHFAK